MGRSAVQERLFAEKAAPSLSTAEVKDLLRARYPSPAWAYISEVGDTTGAYTSRFADALAMSLYPSRGLDLHGFEIKTSRTDWVKELREPAKAEAICAYCDYWWIVTGNDSLVREGELPPTWGLLVAKNGGLSIKVKAPRLESKPLSKGILASILRRTCESLTPEAMMVSAQEEAKKKGYAEGKRAAERAQSYDRADYERLQASVKEFEEAAGVSISRYVFQGGKRIGEAVRMVLDDEHLRLREEVERMRRQAQNVLDLCDRSLNSTKTKQKSLGTQREF